MPSSELSIDLAAEPDALDVLVGALAPESESEVPGVDVSLTRSAPDAAQLTIRSDHLPALRAATNAYLRWLMTIDEVLEATEPAR